MNILEIRKQMNSINNKYDELVSELKVRISELENQRANELGDLPAQYDACVSMIIEQVENGTYTKQSGVSVKTLKNVVITDTKAVPEEYMQYIVNDKKIKADLKESDYTLEIPGVEVKNKYSVAVSI